MKKLAYYTFKQLNRKFRGEVEPLPGLNLGPGTVCLAFSVQGRKVYVLWADHEPPPAAPASAPGFRTH